MSDPATRFFSAARCKSRFDGLGKVSKVKVPETQSAEMLLIVRRS